MLKNTDNDRKKKDFHLIEKMIGAKLLEAKNADAFYGFLASKLVDRNAQCDIQAQRTSALELVGKLRYHMSGKGLKDTVNYHGDFKKKPTAFKELFRKYVGYGFSITAPIVVGLGVAMAFVLGPAFLFAGVGMAALLCVTYYVNSKISERREARLNNYDAMLAQIDMRDRLTDIKLSEKYSSVKSLSDIDKDAAPEAIQMSGEIVHDRTPKPDFPQHSLQGSPTMSSCGSQFVFFCNNSVGSLREITFNYYSRDRNFTWLTK